MLKRKLVSPVLMWLIVILGIFIVFSFFPKAEIFPRNAITSFLIIPAGIYWLYFFIGALRVHRKAALSAAKIDRIVIESVYSVVRHPIYSGDIVLAWGIFFYWPLLKVFISAIWLTIVLFSWMRIEEKVLEEKFGPEYRDYKNKVPMVIPKFIKK
jgi:protein-S-isoprenylcysteine O-methyltransferase Ste14